MTTTSTYGNSVKFYERIYELHGQLKHQEEEQFNLQAELHRLLPQYRSPRSEINDQVADFQKASVPNGTPVPASSGNIQETSVDKISAEEKRRIRNDIILRKIKDLESTAAVFAARSEKLRILRSEYEATVNRYMSKKSHPRLNMSVLSNSTPSLLTLPGGLTPERVTVGVNTEISGPVKPIAQQTEEMRLLKMSTYSHQTEIQNGSHFPPRDCLFPSYSQFTAPTFPTLFQSFEGKPTPSAPPEDSPATQKYEAIIKASNDLLESQQLSGATKNLSIVDDAKLRHNVYFDISTTSESEMTSQKMEKPKRSVPISISFDETTTQSDTASLSAHIPTKLSKKFGMPAMSRHLSIDLSSDPSDSLMSRAKEKIISTPSVNQLTPLNETDQFGNIKEGGKPEEDDENDPPSESMATSVGDSVMDSVQNRTENLQPEVIDSSAENLDKLVNADITPASFSDRDEVAFESQAIKSPSYRRESILESRKATSSFQAFMQNDGSDEHIEQAEKMRSNEPPLHEDLPARLRSSAVDPTRVMRRFSKIEDEFREDQLQDSPPGEASNAASVEAIKTPEEASEITPEGAALPAPQPTSIQPQPPTPLEAPKLVNNTSFDKPSKPPSGSAASRRIKIKMDYDTDSDPSEPINIQKPGQTEKNSDEGIQADDDFDDFFDI